MIHAALLSVGRAILAARVPAVLLLIAIAACVLGGYRIHRAELALAKEKAAHAETVATLERERAKHADELFKAEQTARAEERRINQAQAEVLHAQQIKAQSLERDVARLSAASRSLRDELAAIKAGAASAGADPSASPQCQAAASSAAMLADLLGRCSERREELARYADDSRLAGEECVGRYDALKPKEPNP